MWATMTGGCIGEHSPHPTIPSSVVTFTNTVRFAKLKAWTSVTFTLTTSQLSPKACTLHILRWRTNFERRRWRVLKLIMPLALADVSASVHACKGEQKVRDAERKNSPTKVGAQVFRYQLQVETRSMDCS
jgi:hypothetical protein